MLAVSEQPREGEADDVETCARILRKGSKSFAAASLLLPPRVRGPATVLYAFCRVADDLVDEDGDERCDSPVDALRSRLDRAYRGQPRDTPVDRAFSAMVRRFDLPRALPEALIEGLAWDAEGRTYETIEDLYAYAARVASTVGVMMTILMGERGEETLARACDLGVAMQLTNIARDVGHDASIGRIYLPLSWMREAGIDPDAWLLRPRFDDRIGGVVARLLAQADVLYRRSDSGVGMLPRDCRTSIRAARLIYSDIGRVIASRGHNSVDGRAYVSKARKVWLLVRALFARFETPRPDDAPALAPVAFLVRAGAA